MDEQAKSGHEIIEDFFSDIHDLKNADKEVVKTVVKLYKEGKLTITNLSNELENLREKNIK